jgi:hypothetical protein
MSRRFNSGNRRLAQRLNRRLGGYLTRRLDGRAFCPPDYWAQTRSLLEEYLRLRQRAARRDPHLFGPHARRYFLDTLRLEQEASEIEAALEKVYGPAPEGQRSDPKCVWRERYFIEPGQEKFFRKWFKQHYGE